MHYLNYLNLKFFTMRKVTVVSTATGGKNEVLSSATTWGALKPQLSEFMTGEMKVTVRETRNDLSNADAILPEGDFTLFLFPVKVKSGK